MEIKQTKVGNAVMFRVEGSLSGSEDSTNQLFRQITLALDQKPKEIFLDLANTGHIDSLSIGLLVGILLTCREKSIKFRLQNVTREVKDVLDWTNLKKVFPELY